MPLPFEKPDARYLQELQEVADDAVALIEALGQANAMPPTFPKAELLEIAASLRDLPLGTAQGSKFTLEYARARLPAVRREYIVNEAHAGNIDKSSDEAPLFRGEQLDLRLRALISSVTTALDEYRRQAGEVGVDEASEEAAVANPQDATISVAKTQADAAIKTLEESRNSILGVVKPDSERGDQLTRQIADAQSLTRNAKAEVGFEKTVPSWSRRINTALQKMPAIIRKTGKGIQVGVDVTEPLYEWWEKSWSKLVTLGFEQVKGFGKTLETIGQNLETLGRAPQITWTDEQILRAMITDTLIPQYVSRGRTSLDFSEADPRYRMKLTDISALSNFVDLQSLNLRGTEVSDATPLQGLTTLQSLNLAYTRISDFTSLAGFTLLHSLNLSVSPISDATPLAGLTALQTLNLSGSLVADLTPLAGLASLQVLNLSHTKIFTVTPLSGLTALQELNLSHTKISNVTPLARLTALQKLNLNNSKISNVIALAGLAELKELHLVGTQVSDVTPLEGLKKLSYLNLTDRQVTGFSALEHLIKFPLGRNKT